MNFNDVVDKIFLCAVIIFFLISLSYGGKVTGFKDALLLRLAMFFTAVADFCMLALYDNVMGLVFFCAVQILYSFRFGSVKRTAIPAALFIFLLHNLLEARSIYQLAAIYAFLFINSYLSVIKSFVKKKYSFPNNVLTFAGMTLFLLCDINVGLYNLGVRGSWVLIWIFYFPGQAMLCLSARKFGNQD